QGSPRGHRGCLPGPARRSTPGRRADLRVEDRPHELGREAGLLVGVLDADGLAVDDGERVAELEAEVAAVADLAHRPNEVGVVAVGLLADDPVVSLEAADRAVGPALELAAEVAEHLERADGARALQDALRAAAPGHERGVEARLQVGGVDLADHPE